MSFAFQFNHPSQMNLHTLPRYSAMIKLNYKINLVSDALFYLKKYSPEKFIFNARGLMESPLGKKNFEENFKLVVRK